MNIILEFPLLDGNIHYVDFKIMTGFLEFVQIDPIEFIVCYVSTFVGKGNVELTHGNIERWVQEEIGEYFDLYINVLDQQKDLPADTILVLNYMRAMITGDWCAGTMLNQWGDIDEVFNSITTVLQHYYSHLVLPHLHRNFLEILYVTRLNESYVVVSVGETFTVESAKLYGIKGVGHGHRVPLSAYALS